ncbi:MAG: TIGR02996 domain-containing protein [Polyangiales bacterium]
MELAGLGLAVGARDREKLAAALARANGTRKVRLLESGQLVAAAEDALRSDFGFGIRHGGEANDGTQRTTLCLAVRVDDVLTIGVGLSGASGASPGRTWSSLQPWSKTLPERNRARLEAWAQEDAEDRVRIAITRVPAKPPKIAGAAKTIDALLAQVLAMPEDDAPRAVMADAWLEAGDPRGEYVSLRLSLARKPDRAAERRAAELEANHAAQWNEELRQFTLKQHFSRGFVEEVEMRATAFATHAERLFSLAPITSVVLRAADLSALRKVAAQPLLSRVRRLTIDRNVKDAGALALASAGPHLSSLRELRCGGCGFSTKGYEALLAAMPALEWLHVSTVGAGLAELVERTRGLRVSVTSTVTEDGAAKELARRGRLVRASDRR